MESEDPVSFTDTVVMHLSFILANGSLHLL